MSASSANVPRRHDRWIHAVHTMADVVLGLRAQRLRSMLSVASVAVGTAATIGIWVVMRAVETSVIAELDRIGPSTFTVARFPSGSRRCDPRLVACAWERNPPLRLSEFELIRQQQHAHAVSARVEGTLPVRTIADDAAGASAGAMTRVIGMHGDWEATELGELSDGRSFAYSEIEAGAPVALVNASFARRVIGGTDPLDRTLVVAGRRVNIIGTFSSIFDRGRDEPPTVWVPLRMLHRISERMITRLSIAVRPQSEDSSVMHAVVSALRTERRMRPTEEDNFSIAQSTEQIRSRQKVTGLLGNLVLSMAALSLAIGCLGVATMLSLSVRQRTVEIGIRRAVGATRRQIAMQFIAEGLILSGLGGLVGALLGAGLGSLVTSVGKLPMPRPLPIVAFAVTASLLTGLCAGALPALRAARVRPLDALRKE